MKRRRNFSSRAQILRSSCGRRPPAVAAVGIDVLPEQRDLFIAAVEQVVDLGDDGVRRARTLPPAHIRDDAVGAEIVASVHDVDPGVGIARAEGNILLAHRPSLSGISTTPFCGRACDREGAELLEIVRTEDDIHKREFFAQLFRRTRLLRHAPAHGHEQIWARLFQLFQGADIAVGVIFRVFADAAGIEDDDVRLLFRGGFFFVPARAQDAGKFFRFMHVHLAAVGDDAIFLFHMFDLFHVRSPYIIQFSTLFFK